MDKLKLLDLFSGIGGFSLGLERTGGFEYLDATVQEVEQATGKLNPTWVEWLMGFPMEWTD